MNGLIYTPFNSCFFVFFFWFITRSIELKWCLRPIVCSNVLQTRARKRSYVIRAYLVDIRPLTRNHYCMSHYIWLFPVDKLHVAFQCWRRLTRLTVVPAFANSVDPDRLAFEEVSWSASELFVSIWICLSWGLQRYTLFFLFLLKNIDCEY